MKNKSNSSPHKAQNPEMIISGSRPTRSPLKIIANQDLTLVNENEMTQNKTSQIKMDLTKFSNMHNIQEKKKNLDNILNGIISNVEECSELRQSVKELRNTFNRNETQLKELKSQMQDTQITKLQKTDLNKKIENMIGINRKNKEIEDQLRNKFKVNEQQLIASKNFIVKMFEDQFSFILKLELKELQIKQENKELQMSNLLLSQEATKLNQKLKELENIVKVNSQQVNSSHQNTEKNEDANSRLSQPRKEIEKPNLHVKNLQNFSTPKVGTKIQGPAKTTEIKKAGEQKGFRLLKRDSKKETSPSPQPTSAFLVKLTSPSSFYHDKKPKYKTPVYPKGLGNPQSPNLISSNKPNHGESKLNLSTSQIFPKQNGDMSGFRPASRYSDIHELASGNRLFTDNSDTGDVNLKNNQEYMNSNQEKAKSFCLKETKSPALNFSSVDFDNGSVSTLEVNGRSNDLNSNDIRSVLESEENVGKEKSSSVSGMNIKKSLELYNCPAPPVSLIGTQINQRTDIEGASNNNGPLEGGTKHSDENNAINSRLKCRKGSAYINLTAENNMNSGAREKKKPASFVESTYQQQNSSNKKSPNKYPIRDISNLYGSEQFSSYKKGTAYHSKHDSLVNFESIVKTKSKSKRKFDSSQKFLSSDPKSLAESEQKDKRDIQLDSPQASRVKRNLLSNLR